MRHRWFHSKSRNRLLAGLCWAYDEAAGGPRSLTVRQQKVRQLNVTSVLCNRHLDTSLKCRAVVFLMALLPVIEANSPERLHVTVIIRTQFAPYPLTSCLLLHSSTVLVMSVIGRLIRHITDMNPYNFHLGLKFVQ